MRIIHLTDTHIRERKPTCRTDDSYLDTQLGKLRFALDHLDNDYTICLHSGDLGDSNPMSEFVKWNLIDTLGDCEFDDDDFYVVAGQHDLENHSLNSINRTSLGLLTADHTLRLLNKEVIVIKRPNEQVVIRIYPCSYGEEIPKPKTYEDNPGYKVYNILLMHRMMIDTPLFPGQRATNAEFFFNRHTEFDLILTGDNHQRIIYKDDGRMFINGGSMMRAKSNQVDYKPAFSIIDITNEGMAEETIHWPIDDSLVSTEHRDTATVRDELQEFIQSMGEGLDDISFKANLQSYFARERTLKPDRNRILNLLNERS